MNYEVMVYINSALATICVLLLGAVAWCLYIFAALHGADGTVIAQKPDAIGFYFGGA